MVVKKVISDFIQQNLGSLINNSRRGIATTSHKRRNYDPHERAHPIGGKKPVVSDIKDAFKLIKSGIFFFIF